MAIRPRRRSSSQQTTETPGSNPEHHDDGEGEHDDEEGGGDDEGEGDKPNLPGLESDQEIERATKVQAEQHQARMEIRQREINRQQAAGAGFVNYDEVRKLEERASDKVLSKARMNRGPGVYVLSNLVLTNENGNRTEMPEGARVPDVLVQRLEGKRVKGGRSELQLLIDDEVVEDLR